MELLSSIIMGFKVALAPINLLFATAGVIIGQIVGILPGLGPMVTIAVLLPFTYGLDPIPAIMAFAGIYYGSQFGGAISSILVNAPGTESAVITALEGYPMAKKGKAGLALATAAVSSFTGGMIGTVALIVLSPLMVKVVLTFGAPEYFALMMFALACITGLSEGSTLPKTMFSICIGLGLAMIGMDPVSSSARMTFGIGQLYEGIDFIVLAIGMFAFAEVIKNLSKVSHNQPKEKVVVDSKVGITYKEWLYILPTTIRASFIGFFIGVLPGVGTTTSSPLAYVTEKNLTKNKENFNKGEAKGVAAGEASNNAGAMGAMVPLLTMGIPGSGTTAIMLTAFMILGIMPGPLLFTEQPKLVWGLIASFFIGNFILLALNLPLVRYLVKILQVPNEILFTLVLLLATIGAYSLGMRTFDIWLVLIFGIMGHFLKRYNFPLAPVLVSLILGRMIENNFARSMAMSGKNPGIFFERPISVLLLIAASLFLFIPPAIVLISKKRRSQKNTAVL
ncbi:MAG: tripartite tricarboxylate transporter permease [Bacillota bacterium]